MRGGEVVPDDPTNRFIEGLRKEADESHFMHLTHAAVVAGSRSLWRARLRARAAAVVASVLVVAGGMSGLAYAANGAAPGGLLYPLDRALETIEIGNGGASERLAEVQSLVAGGQAGRGLEHALTVVDDEEARAALEAATARVADLPEDLPEPGGPPEGVLELLEYLAGNVGNVDGGTVAALASQIASGQGTPTGPPVVIPPVVVPPVVIPPVVVPPVETPPVVVPPVVVPPVETPPVVVIPPVVVPPVETPLVVIPPVVVPPVETPPVVIPPVVVPPVETPPVVIPPVVVPPVETPPVEIPPTAP